MESNATLDLIPPG
jgi:all-trans-retinol dehydrogenase (NAD+)